MRKRYIKVAFNGFYNSQIFKNPLGIDRRITVVSDKKSAILSH